MHPVRLFMCIALATVAVSAGAQSATSTGISRDHNPALSVNTLLLGRVADQSTSADLNGVNLQEAELQLTSIVDPYWKANLVFAVHPAHADEAEGEDAEHAHGGYEGDVEVAYIDGTGLPHGFGLRLGKDYVPFGKHAPLHTHQFPFVDAPVAVQAFLGGHGVSEVGARLAREVPLPWYADLEVYAVDGRAEIFDGASRDLAYGARFINLLDLSTTATLELGGSWLHGPQAGGYLALEHAHEGAAGNLDLIGADVTFKWVSAGESRGPALNLTAEVIMPQVDEVAGDPLGWYAHAQYRFARNWWLGAGVGALDRDLIEHDEEHEEGHADEHHDHGLFAWEEVVEAKANLTWTPSEFSALRLEVARYDDRLGDADEWLVSLQANFTIGSHPAHNY
jgi:hypothetical protein